MIRRMVDARVERLILTGMIVSDDFLRAMQHLYRPEFLEIDFVKIVARWCTEYWEEYQRAPGAHIQDIFEEWTRSCSDEDMLELVEKFLSSISSEHERGEQFNTAYVLVNREPVCDFILIENTFSILGRCISQEIP